MKTEHEIAQVNIEELDLELPLDVSLSYPNCQEHKATLQRFLDFLRDLREEAPLSVGNSRIGTKSFVLTDKKIKDIKKAIGEYEKNGI